MAAKKSILFLKHKELRKRIPYTICDKIKRKIYYAFDGIRNDIVCHDDFFLNYIKAQWKGRGSVRL